VQKYEFAPNLQHEDMQISHFVAAPSSLFPYNSKSHQNLPLGEETESHMVFGEQVIWLLELLGSWWWCGKVAVTDLEGSS